MADAAPRARADDGPDDANAAYVPDAAGMASTDTEKLPTGASVAPTEAIPVGPPAETDQADPPAETDQADRRDRADRPDPPVRRVRAGPDVGPIRRVLAVLVVLSGLAAVALAGFVTVAPVESTTSTLSWPRAGADPQAPEPTTAFLVPYRPATLTADIPCPALRDAQSQTAPVTVLATSTSDTTSSLVVRGSGDTVRFLVNGRALPVTIPDGDCTTRVSAGPDGLRVDVGGATVLDRPGEPVPEVFAVTTDLTGAPADGLRLEARTPAWFDNAATDTKSALTTWQVRAAALAFGLLVVLALLPRTGRVTVVRPGTGATPPGTWARSALAGLRRPRTWLLAAVDAVVVVGFSWWSLVGPMTDDDGFAAAIATTGLGGASPSNYYRWYDASEAPFASGQLLLGSFFDLGTDPLTLRLPSLLAGIALWFVVTRGVLRPALGGPAGSTPAVRVLTALALAAWWWPYGLGTRPEPLVALGVTGVLALVLRAVRSGADHPRGAAPDRHGDRDAGPWLAAAVGLAALTLTVAPSGLLAAVPFLLLAPRLTRALRGSGVRAVSLGRVAAVGAAAAGLAGVAVVLVFARQSWHGLEVATAVHRQFGPSHPWYAEWLRYSYLLGEDSWGSATKRLPVLLAIVLAIPALTQLARRGRAALGAVDAEPAMLLGAAPVGLLVLAVTPSKWSHHFGALAGFGTVSVVAVVVMLTRAALRARPDPGLRVVGVVTACGVAAAAAIAFAGPNAWWAYSGAHLPWATGPVAPVSGLPRWLLGGLVATVLVTVALVAVRRRVHGRRDPTPRVLTVAGTIAPAVLTTGALVASIGVLAGSFATAAAPPPGAWTLGAQNLALARGADAATACGLQDRVQVLTTAAGGPLTPAAGAEGGAGDGEGEGEGEATLDGFVEQGGWEEEPPLRLDETDTTRDARFAWGSRGDRGALDVGAMTSPWFTLTGPGADQELALSVAGRTRDGAAVTVEFGQGTGAATTALGTWRVVEPEAPERAYRGYAPDPERARLQDDNRSLARWRTVTVPAAEIPPDADRVRVLARDDRTDESGWVALTGPRLVDVTPLREYLDGRGPVVVDWAVAFAWPCLGDLARVGAGVAQAPGALITTPQSPPDPLPGQRTVEDGLPGDIVPERWTLATDTLVTSTNTGGSFAGMQRAGTVVEVDTRLPGEPGRVWGRLLVPDYEDLETDAYDLRRDVTRTGGTDGDPAPVRDPRPAPEPDDP